MVESRDIAGALVLTGDGGIIEGRGIPKNTNKNHPTNLNFQNSNAAAQSD